MPCFDLEIQEFLEEHAFFKIFATHCFHEIFRVAIFSIQILLKGSFQSCNKSLISQACSGPYWENIGPLSFLYGPRCTQSVQKSVLTLLSRPRADILPVQSSRLVNKIYTYCTCSKINNKCLLFFFFFRMTFILILWTGQDRIF